MIFDVSHQNGVGLVAVLPREWRVDRQADTVTHYCEQNEEIKWFPFHQSDTVFPEQDQIKYLLVRLRPTPDLKGFFKDKQPMAFWARSGGGLAPTRLAGFLSAI